MLVGAGFGDGVAGEVGQVLLMLVDMKESSHGVDQNRNHSAC